MNSIRRQLITSLLTTLFIGSIVVGGYTYFNARAEVDEFFDHNMQQMALAMQIQQQSAELKSIPGKAPPLTDEDEIDDEEEFVIQMWGNDGASIYSSHPNIPLRKFSMEGFQTVPFRQHPWRIYGAQTPQGYVQVSQPLSSRTEIRREIALNILIPLLILLPILAAFNWWIVVRSLKPLSRVSEEIDHRTPDSLEALSEQHIPIEILSLVKALNELLGRLKRAIHAQRAFIADAAHELRTPLAALRLQADNLERSEDKEEQRASLAALQSGISRATRLVQQLLTLARQEPEAEKRPIEQVNLGVLARAMVDEQLAFARRKSIHLRYRAQEPVHAKGNPDSLAILISNLIDNALRYTPENGNVEVALSYEKGNAVLRVRDDGPGIARHERRSVFDRFYRIEGSGVSGTGLGLAIVKAIADKYGMQLIIGAGIGEIGTEIKVIFA